ncbi:Chaperone for wingless signalling and trafficking of LDL receptor [Nesidiocoris tenuis]|uniref:Chaperone for wingless signalling and trafficking of LDL receptor n=1 Tax=Nesidiocoris tenuis TaxID=355587 RepID=A0ABN7AVS9_9HEMI|nr:Chaperone for wingless signalling and trafficking of LDL receptor [Nesidiocoris tenuis]
MKREQTFFWFLLLASALLTVHAKKPKEKPDWAKKDIKFYSDADMERLLDQWEEDEEPLEPDELPEHLRPQPKIDLSQLSGQNPENILKMTKKGQTLMSFVSLDTKDREETERLTKLWQTSLWNNHIQAERYTVDDDRVLFVYKDGSQAWDAKDFLVEQEGCKEVVIENKPYPGKLAKKTAKEEL